MTIDIMVVDPTSITVSKSHTGNVPRIEFSEDHRVLLKSWGQLEDLIAAGQRALDEFYTSELRDEGVGS